MSSDILTVRCRHCGKTFPYLRSDAGATAECPDCKNPVLLPGNLQGVTTKRKARVSSVPTLIMEIGGFLLMFFIPPFGLIVGACLVAFGWWKSRALRCSSCEAPTTKEATRCANCRAAFSSD